MNTLGLEGAEPQFHQEWVKGKISVHYNIHKNNSGYCRHRFSYYMKFRFETTTIIFIKRPKKDKPQ